MMLKRSFLAAAAVLALGAGGAMAAEGGHVEDVSFSFEGPFGAFDRAQLQRGFQVYNEVCSACHGLRYVAFRALEDEGGPGFEPEQVAAFAANYSVPDPEGEPGDTRPGKPADHFPVNTAAGAPDLSLMAKARAGFHGPAGTGLNQLINGAGGPEYIHAILNGYTGEEVEQAGAVLYVNHAMPNGLIRMPPPLADDQIEYQDGTPATQEQMSKDVAAFLMWAAEPKMMDRKAAGVRNIFFLVVLTVLLYLTNKKLWSAVKRQD